jgi:hypothetical protein
MRPEGGFRATLRPLAPPRHRALLKEVLAEGQDILRRITNGSGPEGQGRFVVERDQSGGRRRAEEDTRSSGFARAGPIAKLDPAVRRPRRQRSCRKPRAPTPPPPRTSPGEDPRRAPERGARALPAPPADLVVRTRGPLAVRVSPDVGVQPEPAPKWLPSHDSTLGVADPAGKGIRPGAPGLRPRIAQSGPLRDTAAHRAASATTDARDHHTLSGGIGSRPEYGHRHGEPRSERARRVPLRHDVSEQVYAPRASIVHTSTRRSPLTT